MQRPRSFPGELLLLSTLLVACLPAPETGHLNEALDAASARTGVPRDLLAATAWSLTRFDQREGAVNNENGVGIMDLRVDGSYPSLVEAAAIAGASEDELVESMEANLAAGAEVLAARAAEEGARTGEVIDSYKEWYPLVAAYSGAPDPLVAEGFAAQVYDVLQYGLAVTTDDGELIEVAPVDMDWRRQSITGSSLISSFVPASSSNYTDDNRSSVDTVVIHTVQGSYSGAVSWIQNSSSQVSAHYVIRSSDGQITQMVGEEDIAWHAGHWDTNERSIGIEHEGYVEDPAKWYTDSMYRQSAALVRDICDRYGIPKDRSHIIGHFEVPGCASAGGGGSNCHTDPGSGWDWDYYISLVTGAGSGSSSMGGTGLPDGDLTGTFRGTVRAASYGETDSCDGALSGAASGGRLYLNGTCALKNNPDASGNMPVSWTGTVSGTTVSGSMVADGRSVTWTGTLNSDGSIGAKYSGSKDVGGTVGILDYEVDLAVKPK
ncbi:MAG: N-acetylmuramoyl-L-alanine amidase [Deltaproteobacteria bacterium]|nr:N-acetylmuramoyl-L-alanine amidase [Deltaproteobacteria bacterium]